MRRTRVLLGAGVLIGAVVASAYAFYGNAEPAVSFPTTCRLGSAETRAALETTLRGVDPGVFSDFRMLEPPPPPLESDHYSGPLWAYATIPGSRDRHSRDITGEWEARLVAGAVAERCSAGVTELPKAVAGFTVRYATGRHRLADQGGGYSKAGRVLGAQASGETDAEIIARAKRVLSAYGLTPTDVRVLRPLGPALLVEASTDDVASVRGRVPEVENALDGGRGWGRHPRLEGVYLAIDGPDGPLVRAGNATRDAGGFVWSARGFDTGLQHG